MHSVLVQDIKRVTKYPTSHSRRLQGESLNCGVQLNVQWAEDYVVNSLMYGVKKNV